MGVFHELAHAIVGTLFGWQVKEIYFSSYLDYVSFYPLNYYPSLQERIVVYSSGGIASILIFLVLLNEIKHDDKLFSYNEKLLIYAGLMLHIAYVVYETVLGVLA